MTEKEILIDLKAQLVAQTWTGGAHVVFPTGSVVITTGQDKWALATMRCPIALIKPLDSQSDPEAGDDPNLSLFNVGVRLMAHIPGDAVGENPIMGANRTLGTTYSEGRGIFELEGELFNAIGKLNALESHIIQCTQKSAVDVDVQDTATLAYRDYIFQTWCTVV